MKLAVGARLQVLLTSGLLLSIPMGNPIQEWTELDILIVSSCSALWDQHEHSSSSTVFWLLVVSKGIGLCVFWRSDKELAIKYHFM